MSSKVASLLQAIASADLSCAETLELLDKLRADHARRGARACPDSTFTEQKTGTSSAGRRKKLLRKLLKRHAGAWVESRLIKNCGPYLYLRWRDGGKLRSRYLGKASDYEL